MEKFKFSNEEARRMYDERICALKKVVDERVDDKAYCWDETVKKYAVTMAKAKRVLKSEGINEQITNRLFREIDTFLRRCSENEFHIALVGTIKAGKSTLINALLGHEYASTKVTPETAALTKFRKSEENYVKVSFYSTAEWNQLWESAQKSKATVFLEEYAQLGAEKEKDKWLGGNERKEICNSEEELADKISSWTSSRSVAHYFVKEVEVGVKDFDLPEGIVLVDTPGLDDVVAYRSDITRRYIDRANAVLVCVKSDALTGPEWKTISGVFVNANRPEKVYIIATQIDTLNRPKKDWEAQREEWLKYLRGVNGYADRKLAERNLIQVSAYLYLLLGEYNTLDKDGDKYYDLSSILIKLRTNIENISDSTQYKNMIDFTNIKKLKGEIHEKFSGNYKRALIEDIEDSYLSCKDSIRETLERIKKRQEEIVQTSQCSLEEIQNKKRVYEQKCEQAERDRKELEALLTQLRNVTNERAQQLTKAIRGIK